MLADIPDDLTKEFNAALPILYDRGLNILGALLILLFGLWFAGRAKRWTVAALRRAPNLDSTVEGFFGSLVSYAVIVFTVLAVLARFGVQTTSLIALLGAAGIAIGLALQGTLTNVAAGCMLFVFRPFRAGQYVEVAGIGGTVRVLTLFTTELATPDNVQIIIPNGKVWGEPIRNFSFHASRRVEIIFRISYDADAAKALAAIRQIVDGDARILKTPEPLVTVSALGDISVDILVRIWSRGADLEAVKFDLLRLVKAKLAEMDIDIPQLPHIVKQDQAHQ